MSEPIAAHATMTSDGFVSDIRMPNQITTLYDLTDYLREKIIAIHTLRDQQKAGSAQHYWHGYSAKRFELAYEHIQFSVLLGMHLNNMFKPRLLMPAESKKQYKNILNDCRHYMEQENVDTLITERLLDMHSSMWFGFESLIKWIAEKNDLPKQKDFTETYKSFIKDCQFHDQQNKLDFIKGFKLIRASEHNNYRPNKSFVITIPSMSKRINIDGTGNLDIGNKFNLIDIDFEMVRMVDNILSRYEASTKCDFSTGYE